MSLVVSWWGRGSLEYCLTKRLYIVLLKSNFKVGRFLIKEIQNSGLTGKEYSFTSNWFFLFGSFAEDNSNCSRVLCFKLWRNSKEGRPLFLHINCCSWEAQRRALLELPSKDKSFITSSISISEKLSVRSRAFFTVFWKSTMESACVETCVSCIASIKSRFKHSLGDERASIEDTNLGWKRENKRRKTDQN